jgi:two-component system response regulator
MDTDRYKVLLIDDDLSQIDLARRAVAESRPEIDLIAVGGGDAVLDWISASIEKKEHMPHIILLDLKLPKLDGLAVLRRLRGYAATSDIPIVVYSAEYIQEEVLMGYKAGANSFVAKPTDLVQFIELFRECLAYWMHPHQRKLIFAAKDGGAERI